MKKKLIYTILISVLLSACGNYRGTHNNETSKKNGCTLHTFINKNPHDVSKIQYLSSNKKVKNVVLMIGDGMGFNVVQAAWAANKGNLFLESAHVIGLKKTTSQDSLITDSSASATAMATGVKTNRGYVGIDAHGNSLKTICEYAKEEQLATGIMTTCRIYDATPASFAIENIDRNNSDAIAEAFIDCNIDFVLGGGRKYFNQRKDKQNLIPLLEQKGYAVATSIEELEKIPTSKIFGLVAEHDMPIARERDDDLWRGAKKALEVLSKNEKGFFLMIESAMIDDFGHGNKLPEMMEETLDFDRTVGNVFAWAAQHPETLVIVTADHATGGFTLTEGTQEKGEIKGYYSTNHHDGAMVPVYAFGNNAELFGGIYDNTDLFKKIKYVLNL